MSEELEDILGSLFQIIYDYNNTYINSTFTKQCIDFLLKEHQISINVYNHHIVYNINFLLTELDNNSNIMLLPSFAHRSTVKMNCYLISELKWLINLNIPIELIQTYIKNPYFARIYITTQIRNQSNLMKLKRVFSNEMGNDFSNYFYNTWKY